MRLKFLKYFYGVVLGCLATGYASSQVLDTNTFHLNTGGVIHDVVYDEWHDCYIVVGNFTSIGGYARRNIAFINRTTLDVMTPTYAIPVTAMNGEIRSVAIGRTIGMTTTTFHLYLGGNFSSVTGSSGGAFTRNGIVKLIASKPNLSPPSSTGTFVVSSWNADLDMTPLLTGFGSEGVDDILIQNDTVIFCGKFMAVNDASTYDLRDGVAAYALSGSLLSYPAFASTGTYVGSRYFTIEKTTAHLYVGGYLGGIPGYAGRLYKLDSAGDIIPAFNFNNSNLVSVFDIEIFEDSLLFVAEDRNAANNEPETIRMCRMTTGVEKLNHTLSLQGGTIGSLGGSMSSLAVQNNFLFTSTSVTGSSVVSFEGASEGPPVTGIDWNANATNNLTLSQSGKIHVAGNRLFISAPNLTTLSGQPRLRVGIYCIEPHPAEFFTQFDTTICPDDSLQYAIDPVDFADGYRWQYSGTGADFTGDNTPDSGPMDLAYPFVPIEFTSTFTAGVLSVTPYTYCNNLTKVFGNTVSINIHSNPIPNANAGIDSTLTCERDSIILFGYSDSTVVSYEWVYPFPIPNQMGQYDTATTAGNYIFKVLSPLGCPGYDTMNISMDTISPVAVPPIPPYELTCAIPVQNFSGTSPTPNTIYSWYQGAAFYPNPITVSAEGSYFFRATDTSNGCFKDVGIYVSLNNSTPNIQISGYGAFNPAQPLDTLTCYETSLNLTVYSDTSNTSVNWMNADTTIFYGDNLNIFSPGNYYIFATNNDNGCTNSMGINIASFQNGPNALVPNDKLLNCSVDSVVLDGASLIAGTQLEWTGTSISPSTNPVTIYNPGTYYLTSTDPTNGCMGIDSVVVSQDNSINVFAGNDTLICNGDLIPLSASYQGTISGIAYQWSNSSTLPTTTYSAGSQPYAVVLVTGDGGCIGTDTVYLNLPPSPVITFQGFQPCDGGASGQLVATPMSGLDPFTYSIDNGITFQSSPVFTGLTLGDYPIIVRDSIQCEYPFLGSIDETSEQPTPAFLFSTYNFSSDTVAIIDVSNPPTDSTLWIFSSSLILIDENPLAPIIIVPDTGAFPITMQAYYGACVVEITKMLYASEYDSLHATFFNSNGIKSLILYPNPTTGTFSVDVEFYKAQRSSAVVQDMIGNTYEFMEFPEADQFSFDVSLDETLVSGTYTLKLISEFDSATITFILNR